MNDLLTFFRDCLGLIPGYSFLFFDEDHLFSYQQIRDSIPQDEYQVITVFSQLDLRLAYEKNRNKLIFAISESVFDCLPDIKQSFIVKRIGMTTILPRYNRDAIFGLEFNTLNKLYQLSPYEDLSYENTIRFILEQIYNVDFDTLKGRPSVEVLFSVLMSVYYSTLYRNKQIDTFLSEIAARLLPKSHPFFSIKFELSDFLQNDWENYLSKKTSWLDYSNDILGKSMAHLFLTGEIKKVKVTQQSYESLSPFHKVGVYYDRNESDKEELDSLISYLESASRIIEDDYKQWFELIVYASRAKLLAFTVNDDSTNKVFSTLIAGINKRFQIFLNNCYDSLFSLSGIKRPVTVSRILDHLNSCTHSKKALLVVDGLSYWQWLLLSEECKKSNINFIQSASLSFIPSITAWSRQSIFGGKRPDLSKNNSNESTLFYEYWKNHGYCDSEIQYLRTGLTNPASLDFINEAHKILGIVTNDLDEIMHGIVVGDHQLFLSTKSWLDKSIFVELLIFLRENGYKVFLTSDHGNLECDGIGNIVRNSKVGISSRSKRHLVFDNDVYVDNVIQQYPGLSYLIKNNTLYLCETEAFYDVEKKIISHGGSHLFEVIVPFIEFE